jgi:Flp pilus assembly protein TadD
MKKKVLSALFVLSIFIPSGLAWPDENLDAAKELFYAQDYKKAVDHLKKATKKDPSNTEAWVLLGDSYRFLGKDKKAIKAYEMAIENDPSQKEALLGAGISYINLRKRPHAIGVLKHLVEIDPSNALAHFYLGVSYEGISRMSQAWEEYTILKTLDKKLADELYRIIFW